MTTPALFLEIKDWRTHQHYGKRNPPWIKLYTRLLDDATFMALPDAAQLQLVKLWILAAKMGHPLPNDPRLLAGKIGCRGKLQLDALIASGFVSRCYQNASEVLAKPLQEFAPLSTENREQRTESVVKEQDPLPSGARVLSLNPAAVALAPEGARHAELRRNGKPETIGAVMQRVVT